MMVCTFGDFATAFGYGTAVAIAVMAVGCIGIWLLKRSKRRPR